MAERTVSREAELAGGERFLDAVLRGPSTLLFEGEAGIGKTTVWQGGPRFGRTPRVPSAAVPAPANEAGLSFSVLSDLLSTIDDGTFGMLPGPQRRGLAMAMRYLFPNGYGHEDDRAEATLQRAALPAVVGVTG